MTPPPEDAIKAHEPRLPAQGFFNVFMMLCTCGHCGDVSEPVMLGKL
jgi:hypothetical protein